MSEKYKLKSSDGLLLLSNIPNKELPKELGSKILIINSIKDDYDKEQSLENLESLMSLDEEMCRLLTDFVGTSVLSPELQEMMKK